MNTCSIINHTNWPKLLAIVLRVSLGLARDHETTGHWHGITLTTHAMLSSH